MYEQTAAAATRGRSVLREGRDSRPLPKGFYIKFRVSSNSLITCIAHLPYYHCEIQAVHKVLYCVHDDPPRHND